MKSYDRKAGEIEELLKQAEMESYEYSFDRESRGYDPDYYIEVYYYCDSYALEIDSERIVDDGEIYLFDAECIKDLLLNLVSQTNVKVIKEEGSKSRYWVCFLDSLARVTI